MDETMGNQQERTAWIYWLAGLIEGEGCISLNWCSTSAGRRRMIRPSIKIGMTDLAIVEKAASIMNDIIGCGCFIHHRAGTRGHYLQVHEVIVDGALRCKKLIEALLPVLISKKSEAEVMMKFIEYRLSLPNKSPYGDFERRCKELCSALKQNRAVILNDYTPAVAIQATMI